MELRKLDRVKEQTIKDFGEQWTAFRENKGYYASVELLKDIIAPLVNPDEIQGRRVAEIGSGTGRIVNMLLGAGAAHVLAIEPSAAYDVLKENTKDQTDRLTLLKATGEQIPPSGDLDYVFSIGVLHHIPEPEPVVRAAYQAVRPGGKLCVWLYGKEGNRLLLSFWLPLRWITKRLPHVGLMAMVWFIYIPLRIYMAMCRVLPFLPLRRYLLNVLGKFDPPTMRWCVIYDQLNPAYAKYYTRDEAHALLASAGFQDVQIYHRHGYSWTVVGTRPA